MLRWNGSPTKQKSGIPIATSRSWFGRPEPSRTGTSIPL